VPKPRRDRHHYHRALAPNSPYRKHVVGYAGRSLPDILDDPNPSSSIKKLNEEARIKIRYVWAILLSRVYELMPLLCSKCGGEMKIIAFVKDQSSIYQILDYLELPLVAPPLAPARGPPQEYDQVGFEFEESFDELPDDDIDQSTTW